jgi:uncharacterized protein
MHSQTISLLAAGPGAQHNILVHHFGENLSGPKAYIQAALHADEVPALLVAQQLRTRLSELDAAGQLLGPVVLVPFANPLGLTQQLMGQHQGRFNLGDGINFNRLIPDLSAAVVAALAGQLGKKADDNVAAVRRALRKACTALTASDTAQDLKNKLLALAIDADVVLDLHCDGEAAMHLYGLTPQADLCTELGALLSARAVLLATESGDSPFDESCSRPWLALQQAYPDLPVPLACFSTTVELRGQADTSHDLAQKDAAALIEFLRRVGTVAGPPKPLHRARCEATPLAGSEPIVAPGAGVLVFHAALGSLVEAGALIADLVDVQTGEVLPLRSQSAGVLYARVATRWATAGQRVAKVAGSSLLRTGKLLSA